MNLNEIQESFTSSNKNDSKTTSLASKSNLGLSRLKKSQSLYDNRQTSAGRYRKNTTPVTFTPNCNVIVKNPFKHFEKDSCSVYADEKSVDPSNDLLKKTVKSITNFVFKVELERKNAGKNNVIVRTVRHGRFPTHHPGLKPLNVVNKNGPQINHCLGILKEIYDKKVQLLAQKKMCMNKSDHARTINTSQPSLDYDGANS